MAANITEGEVRWGSEDGAALFAVNPNFGIYEDYVVENHYYKEGSTYALGCASPAGFRGVSTSFVQLSSPLLIWVAEWTAARTGYPPEIPSPLLLRARVVRLVARFSSREDPVWVLLDEKITARNIFYVADGNTPYYRISGTYVYGCLNPSTVLTRDVKIPKPAWALEPLQGRTIPDGLLVQRVIN